MNQSNIFWLRILAVFEVITALVNFAPDNPFDVLFRILLLASGLLIFYKRRAGVILSIIAQALSIPEIKFNFFYWPPIVGKFMGFRFNAFCLESPSQSICIGVDILSIFLLLFLIHSLKNLVSAEQMRKSFEETYKKL